MKYQHKLLVAVVVVGLIVSGIVASACKGGDGRDGRAYSIQKLDDGWRIIGHIVKYEGKTYLFNIDGGIIEHKSP